MSDFTAYAGDDKRINFRWPRSGPFKVYLRDNKTLCDTLLDEGKDYTVARGVEHDLVIFGGIPPRSGTTVILAPTFAPPMTPAPDKRLTDERLAEIRQVLRTTAGSWVPLAVELLDHIDSTTRATGGTEVEDVVRELRRKPSLKDLLDASDPWTPHGIMERAAHLIESLSAEVTRVDEEHSFQWGIEHERANRAEAAARAAREEVERLRAPFIGKPISTICAGCGQEIIAYGGAMQCVWVESRGFFHSTSCVGLADLRALSPTAEGKVSDE